MPKVTRKNFASWRLAGVQQGSKALRSRLLSARRCRITFSTENCICKAIRIQLKRLEMACKNLPLGYLAGKCITNLGPMGEALRFASKSVCGHTGLGLNVNLAEESHTGIYIYGPVGAP